MDALPIQESNSFGHGSTVSNVSHKCGHDGHTTILLGLARALTDLPLHKGRVILLWQPAEETGTGAMEMIRDKLISELSIDYVFALHNIPGYPFHRIILKNGLFTPQVKSLIIRLFGKTAHAAEPEHGHNPALTISKIIQFDTKITNNDPGKKDFFLATPVYMNLGSPAYGTSAGYAEIHFTIRSWSPQLFEKQCDHLISFAEEQGRSANLKITISWVQEFYANQNDPEAVDLLRKASDTCHPDIETRVDPFKWGEDFGVFTQRYKGAMFGLGAGMETPALHNPDYDFPDEIMASGIKIFYETIKQVTG
jgi:amidohydrolase